MSGTPVQPLERQDIHKSCRTIETLSNALNDYCEAASAFATLQKRLSRALKDAAGLKTMAQFAASAFGASAVVLEVLADVDSKFAKMAEKESHHVSSEVKKWFKKLAKEEKAHDERMNESNARVKQAGQAYEKKSKKGARDAGEEHARYVNLLSVIGPEMSQEKHNHAVHVTQQNTLVTFSVAASVSRIADAEWIRTCECMRRISPLIGSLGESRSLCESAWTGPLPNDLPVTSLETLPAQASITPAVSEWGQTGLSTPARRLLPVPPVTRHSPESVSASAETLLDPLRSPSSAATENQGSVNSITTLSAFPFPPTHLPVPLAMNEGEWQRQQLLLQSHSSAHSRAGSPNPIQPQSTLAPTPILTNSPKRISTADLPESLTLDASGSSHPSQKSHALSTSRQSSSEVRAAEAQVGLEPLNLSPQSKESIKPMAPSWDPKKPRRPSSIARVPPPSENLLRPVSPLKRVEHPSAEKEFGVHADSNRSATKSHSVDVAKKNLDRTTSTHSTGNNVTALRNKYTRTVEAPSQGPRDIPRLHMSVSEIASRYQVDEPLSPRRAGSPIVDRFPLDTPAHMAPRDLPIDENAIQRRKQRIEELAKVELKERAYEFQQRERDLDLRGRDFEPGRLQFLPSRPGSGNTTDGLIGPRINNRPFLHKRGSKSVTHLNVSLTTAAMMGSSGSVPPPLVRPGTSHSPMRSPLLPPKDHAPFCGCDTCSVSKYKTTDISPSSRDLRPPESPIVLRPSKPKGWIRRLSMPSVSVAFSLDAKKNASAVSLKSGLPLPAENGQLRKRSFERISNGTMTGIGR